MNKPRRFFISEFAVGGNARIVPDLGVRRHFNTVLTYGPAFGGAHQGPADTLASKLRFDKPAFEIAYMIAVTILGKRADRCFKNTRKAAILQLRNEDKLRVRVLHNIKHLCLVLILKCGIPKHLSQTVPFRKISLLEWSDAIFKAGHWLQILTVFPRRRQESATNMKAGRDDPAYRSTYQRRLLAGGGR